MALKSRIAGGFGLLLFLSRPLEHGEALSQVTRQVAGREDRFLASARDLIYADSESPYRKLLEWSGCAYGDLIAAVRRRGIEGALSELHDAGVHVTLEEFKGLRPIIRKGLLIESGPEAFDSTRSSGGIAASTSGSRSTGTQVMFGWDLIAEHAATEMLLEELHGALDSPRALWLPVPPGLSGIHAVLIHAKYRRRYERWFTQIPRFSVTSQSIDARTLRLGSMAIGAACALYGCRIPRAEVVPADEALEVARWMAEKVAAGHPPVVRAYASGAIRVAEAALEAGLSLEGSIIFCGGEPATPARSAFVERAGIRLIPRYSAADAGLIGAACDMMQEADDMHIYTNRFAAIIAGGTDQAHGPLLLSTLSPHTSKVLFNTSIGDTATLSSRACACTFGMTGMDLHLSNVRSSEKVTHEGMNVNVVELERLVTGIVERAGGSPSDFQFWSVEDSSGVSRLELAIDPRLDLSGDVEKELLHQLGAELRGGGLTAEIWSQGTTLSILRQPVQHSGRGKLHPVLKRRP
ncbi:MAG TPA: hypothetical protein VMS12_01770 [Thermoanaerobaculia bacterium]|nr:hypothetical protein [Thermoanaerobaculia bacterium]